MLTCTSHSTPSSHAHKHTSSTQRHKHNRLERLPVTQVSIVVDFKPSAFAALLFSSMFDDDTKTKCAAFKVWVSVLTLPADGAFTKQQVKNQEPRLGGLEKQKFCEATACVALQRET